MSTETRYGVIYDEPIDDYHANAAISKSKLDVLINCTPELFHAKYIAKTIPNEEEKEWAVLGNAAGAFILEGEDVFNSRYILAPEDAPKRPTDKQINAVKKSPATVAAIEYWKKWDTENGKRSMLTERQFQQVRGMHAQIQNHELARALLSRGKPEVTFRFKCHRFDLQARTDWVCMREHGGASPELVRLLAQQGLAIEEGQPYAVDLKSTANLSDFTDRRFDASFTEYCYHRQGPFYRSVIQDVADECIDHFFFLAVEKKEPFGCEVYLPSEDANEKGWNEVAGGLRTFLQCITNDTWPGLKGGFHRLSMAPWYKSPFERKERV